MEPPEMEPPGVRFQKYLKEQLKKFAKTPFVIPLAIGISAIVYYFVILYGSSFCLIGLVTPLVLLGVCWYFGVRSVKKLLIVGVLASVILAGVYSATITNQYQHLKYNAGASDDKNVTLQNGTVQPLYGDKATVYEFGVTLHVKNNASDVTDVVVVIQTMGLPSYSYKNYTMVEQSREILNNTTGEVKVRYVYNTTVPDPVNWYLFGANISNNWYVAADFSSNPAKWLAGPMAKDTNAILGVVLPIALLQSFISSVFPTYAIIVVMIWWLRRTRRMRKTEMEKWEEKRAKEEAMKPKEDVKVSLQRKAMGLEDEGTFVCSECGADVPAEATVCPKCGEKFE